MDQVEDIIRRLLMIIKVNLYTDFVYKCRDVMKENCLEVQICQSCGAVMSSHSSYILSLGAHVGDAGSSLGSCSGSQSQMFFLFFVFKIPKRLFRNAPFSLKIV